MIQQYNILLSMGTYSRIFLVLGTFTVIAFLCVGALVSGGYYYVAPGLPQAEELRDVRPQTPLSVYSRDGRLISQFGTKRSPLRYEDMPQLMVQAVLAAEDDRFFEHPGIDYQGVIRAMTYFVLTAGKSRQGGSTITQQIARQRHLTRDRTLVRKFKEWVLALRMEREFSKQEILEIYLNTTFLGQNSYGVAAAAQSYFGKNLSEINVSEAAILAGIPAAPSLYNPVRSADVAAQRRGYVLSRMLELGFITTIEYEEALNTPIESRLYGRAQELDAPYVAARAYREAIRRFGEEAATNSGLKIKTTIDSRLQNAADFALRKALISYDKRHGYRGPLFNENWLESDWNELLLEKTKDFPSAPGVFPGLVVSVDEILSVQEQLAEISAAEHLDMSLDDGLQISNDELEGLFPVFQAKVYFTDQGTIPVDIKAVRWAAPYINSNRKGAFPNTVADVLKAGDVVQFERSQSGELTLTQVPDIQGALISIDPQDGAITALSGGFNFYDEQRNGNFNRAMDAGRQPGSSFKPFIYSAALERGFTAASIINDAPIVEQSSELETFWRPENYSGEINGPTRLREALIKSLNLVSIRVLRSPTLTSGVSQTIQHLERFGFGEKALPRNNTLALGSGSVSPLDVAQGYAVFANGGYNVRPYMIETIEDDEGQVIYRAEPTLVCSDCIQEEKLDTELINGSTELYYRNHYAKRTISAQNAYLINDMMQDNVRRGTGRRAYRELGRDDLSGKTGTTNDSSDVWFAGYNGDLVTAAWIGFDQVRSLGTRETGASTALPMWIDYMREALDGAPSNVLPRPPGIIDVRINPETGLIADAGEDSIFEKFRIDFAPQSESTQSDFVDFQSDRDYSESSNDKRNLPGSIF
ncbi:MAG: peptidase [Rhodospirillaceae bacterium]|nr:peptidase [Rhodospirillaceae bacterium]|tara:strand:+ start:8706 stop:11321 length:2616 start_codon:yes stop_codon:yes gene_type:complete